MPKGVGLTDFVSFTGRPQGEIFTHLNV